MKMLKWVFIICIITIYSLYLNYPTKYQQQKKEIENVVKNRIVIAVPFRARETHLQRLTSHFETYFKKYNQDFVLWVVEQDDTKPFNRGWLTNVAIKTIIKEFGEENIRCIIQHDVDRYPIGFVNYTDCVVPTQLSSENNQWKQSVPYPRYTGGVVSMSTTHWKAVNGMSNMFYGYGGEDDDLYYRLRAAGLLTEGKRGIIHRPAKPDGRFAEWHDKFHGKRDRTGNVHMWDILKAMKHGSPRWKTDGLDSAKYSISDFHMHGKNTYHLKVYHEDIKKLLYASLGGGYAKHPELVAAGLVHSAREAVPENLVIKLFSEKPINTPAFVAFAKRMNVVLVVCPGLVQPYATTRFSCYLDELRNENNKSKIALLDTEDVVIKRDIYKQITTPLYLVQEPVHFPIGVCPFHRRWITSCPVGGSRVFQQLSNESMICAGTIFGTVSGIKDTLKVFTRELRKTHCNDQGLLNILAYTNKLPHKPTFWKHEDGIVLSMNVAKTFNHSGASVAHTGDNSKAHKSLKNFKLFRDVLTPAENKRSVKLLTDIDRVCKKNKIDYAIDGGTLVGAKLNGKRIPWDDDMDIYTLLEDSERLLAAFRKAGLSVGKSYNGLYYKVWDNANPKVDNGKQHGFPFVDIGLLKNINETHIGEVRIAEAKYSRHMYRREWIFPSKPIQYEGVVVRAPRDTDSFLNWRFGEQWRENCVFANWDHQLERVRHPNLGDGNTKISVRCDSII